MINVSNQTPDRKFENIIADLQRKIEELKTNQISIFVIPKLTSDPASPIEGQIWENVTSHTLKVYLNGSIRTVTTS